MLDARKQAKTAIALILDASKSNVPEKFLGRSFVDLFESGNGSEVMRCIMDEYYTNENLRRAIKKVDHWIGIETYPKRETLFS